MPCRMNSIGQANTITVLDPIRKGQPQDGVLSINSYYCIIH